MREIEQQIRRYCYLPSEEAYVAVTAWTVATHVAPLLDTAPGLVVTAPLDGAPRSRLRQVVAGLAAQPIVTTPSEASADGLFRSAANAATPSTVFLDDADGIFKSAARGSKGRLRTFLDSCHTRGLIRVKFDEWGEEFEPFAIVCLMAAGRLPVEVEDRAVVIRMTQAGETPDLGWFRRRDVARLAGLANVLTLWAEQNREEIAAYLAGWVGSPLIASKSRLKDHAAENWEPLLALADLAGHGWLDRVTEAAEVLDRQYQDEKMERSASERLLREVGAHLVGRTGFIGTTELTELLCEPEGSYWATSGLTPTRLARTLRLLGLGPRRNSTGTRRGYQVAELRGLVAKHIDASDASDASDGSDTSKTPLHAVRSSVPERKKAPWAGDPDTKSEPPALLV